MSRMLLPNDFDRATCESFEIILTNGMRYICVYPTYRWQYGVAEGDVQSVDRSTVEIINIETDEVICTLTGVAVVGRLEAEVIRMPPSPVTYRCDKCGRMERKYTDFMNQTCYINGES